MVCPSVESVRLALEAAFGSVGVPVAFEHRVALRTPRSGRPSSLCCASRGWAASDPSSTRTCARRTPAFRVGTSIGSKAVCAGAVCFVATGRSP